MTFFLATLLALAASTAAEPSETKPVSQLLSELHAADTETRQWAALGLADPKLADDAVIQGLLGALRDADKVVRTSARYALGETGAKAGAALKAYDESRLKRLAAKLADPNYEDLIASSISIERSGCEGHRPSFRQCPEYSVRVHGDGAVLYDGGRGVKAHGRQAAAVSLDAVRALLGVFGKAGFFSLEEEYKAGADKESHLAGDIVSHDREFITLSVAIGGETHRVQRYAADESQPALLKLEETVDRALDTKRWVDPSPEAKDR